MSLTTTINLTAGGSSDEIIVEDQNGNNLPPADITWAVAANIIVMAAVDGLGFTFTAAATAPAGTVTTQATYTGPENPQPVVGPTLNVIIAAAPPTVTGLQYNEVSGS